MTPCYIFDIDGTMANGDHRVHHIKKSPKDWKTYFALCAKDEPIEPVIDLIRKLSATTTIVYASGRAWQCRMDTKKWLERLRLDPTHLYMRKEGDFRNDDILKLEFLDQIIADGFTPLMVFDDRNRVVKAWRSRGLICAQVAEGDF